MEDRLATIRAYARYWADPDPYQVSAEDLRYIFSQAGCEQIPSETDATKSIKNLSEGCYIGKQTKHWCGIFATMVPALDWLSLNAQKLGVRTPGQFFWASGVLSSMLHGSASTCCDTASAETTAALLSTWSPGSKV